MAFYRSTNSYFLMLAFTRFLLFPPVHAHQKHSCHPPSNPLAKPKQTKKGRGPYLLDEDQRAAYVAAHGGGGGQQQQASGRSAYYYQPLMGGDPRGGASPPAGTGPPAVGGASDV
jgi:hypothetical protein